MEEAETRAAHMEAEAEPRDEHFYLHSHKLGAIRLSNLFLTDMDGPVSSQDYEAVRYMGARGNFSITKELPLEYAVELNRLIELEMEGSVG